MDTSRRQEPELRRVVEEAVVSSGSEVLRTRLEELDRDVALQIGFVGEWNSGKSTLINALLGRKLLPAMPSPTTASITEVEAVSGLQELQLLELRGEDAIEIDALEFSEIATGKQPGRVRVKVPSSQFVPAGYRLVDTPGLSSLDKLHFDVTFGYLPFLDGIVVCHDMGRGDLPSSLLSFLKREDILPMLGRTMIVLTCVDRKPLKARQAIWDTVKRQLAETLDSDTYPGPDLPIVQTSARTHLDGQAAVPFELFTNQLAATFVAQQQALMDARRHVLLDLLGADVLGYLQELCASTELEEEDLLVQAEALGDELTGLRQVEMEQRVRLQRCQENLRRRLQRIAAQFTSRFAAAESQELESLGLQLTIVLTNAAKEEASLFGQEVELPDTSYFSHSLVGHLQSIITRVDWGVTVATAIAAAALSGGTGAAANAGEAAAGAGVRSMGKSLGKAAVVAAVNASPGKSDGSNKVDEKETGEGDQREGNSERGSVIRQGFQALGSLIKEVNPLEYVGREAARFLKKRSADVELPAIAGGIAHEVVCRLESTLEESLFRPTRAKILLKQEALRRVHRERSRRQDALYMRKQEWKENTRRVAAVLGDNR